MFNLAESFSAVIAQLQFTLTYLHKNAWTIIFIIAVIDPFVHQYQAKQSYKDATNPDRVAVLGPDMKRIRAKQQEIAVQRALEAAEEKKQKKAEERARKRVKSPEEEKWEKLKGRGERLGDECDDGSNDVSGASNVRKSTQR